MKVDRYSCDVMIVGASLAGSAAAITLAQLGATVTLLDRTIFPRQKSCGEGFSHLGVKHLRLLGVEPSRCARDDNQFFGYRFVLPSFRAKKREFLAQTPLCRGWGISRSALDTLVIERARELSGIELRLGVDALSVAREGNNWCVQTSRGSVKAKFLVVANGASSSSLCREYIQTHKAPSARVGYTLLAKLIQGELPKLVTLIPLRDGEIYITTLSADTANVSLVGKPSFIQAYRGREELTTLLNTALNVELSLSRRGFGGSHFEARHKSIHPQLFLVGDAIESFDPACGMGMTHALSSGISAGSHIASTLRGSLTPTSALSEYEYSHEYAARGVRRYSTSIRRLLKLYQTSPSLFTPLSGAVAGRAVALLEKLTFPLRELEPL
jgi:flavin-dependent dehydrogenase